MIVEDKTRTVPDEWTDDLCIELWEHAHDLGRNGNPGGYGMTIDLFPFVGVEDGRGRLLRTRDEWDFDGMRAWIAAHPDNVRQTWQRTVLPESW